MAERVHQHLAWFYDQQFPARIARPAAPHVDLIGRLARRNRSEPVRPRCCVRFFLTPTTCAHGRYKRRCQGAHSHMPRSRGICSPMCPKKAWPAMRCLSPVRGFVVEVGVRRSGVDDRMSGGVRAEVGSSDPALRIVAAPGQAVSWDFGVALGFLDGLPGHAGRRVQLAPAARDDAPTRS